MLRQDVLRRSLPDVPHFETALAQSPRLSAHYLELFPELSRSRANEGRRFLVYGLQASGSALFAHLLAQTAGAAAVPDLWAGKLPPTPDALELTRSLGGGVGDVILKAIVSSKFPFPTVAGTFQPHVKVLFLRHPAHALSSMRRKGYAKKSGTGTLEVKLNLTEDVFRRQREYGFDANLTYEELCGMAPATGGGGVGGRVSGVFGGGGGGGGGSGSKDNNNNNKNGTTTTTAAAAATAGGAGGGAGPSGNSIIDNHPLFVKLTRPPFGFSEGQARRLFRFGRSGEEVRRYTLAKCGWCRRHSGSAWDVRSEGNENKRKKLSVGFALNGNHVDQFPTPKDHNTARRLAPSLYGWYRGAYPKLSEGAGVGKRVFVYGMQSSGASTFLFLLAQIPRSVGIIDLYVGRPAPGPGDFDLSVSPHVFLKGTVNTNISIDEYIATFEPDITLLFVRHPEHNLKSLKSKFYADVAGRLDDKFRELEDAWRRRAKLFDEVIHYEELMLDHASVAAKLQGVGFSPQEVSAMFALQRPLRDITRFSVQSSVWCRRERMLLWDVVS